MNKVTDTRGLLRLTEAQHRIDPQNRFDCTGPSGITAGSSLTMTTCSPPSGTSPSRPNGPICSLGPPVMIRLVTALLNLDPSVAFLTPVLVYTARSRGAGETALLYGCLLLSNAGSLFLPSSNLTNLIVLGHLHLSGGAFIARMWSPALAALVVTTVAVLAPFLARHRD